MCRDCHVVHPRFGDTAHISAPGAVSDGVFFQDKASAEDRGEGDVPTSEATAQRHRRGRHDVGRAEQPLLRHGHGRRVSRHRDHGYGGLGRTPRAAVAPSATRTTPHLQSVVGAPRRDSDGVRGSARQHLDNSNTRRFGGCTECHTDAPSTAHHDGTMDSRANGNRQAAIQFAAADVGYTNVAPPTCSPPGPWPPATATPARGIGSGTRTPISPPAPSARAATATGCAVGTRGDPSLRPRCPGNPRQRHQLRVQGLPRARSGQRAMRSRAAATTGPPPMPGDHDEARRLEHHRQLQRHQLRPQCWRVRMRHLMPRQVQVMAPRTTPRPPSTHS